MVRIDMRISYTEKKKSVWLEMLVDSMRLETEFSHRETREGFLLLEDINRKPIAKIPHEFLVL